LILIETDNGIPLTSDKAEQLVGKGAHSLALVFPEGYTEQVLKTSKVPQEEKATSI